VSPAEAFVRSLVVAGPPALPRDGEWPALPRDGEWPALPRDGEWPAVHAVLADHRLAAWAWSRLCEAQADGSLPFDARARLFAAHAQASEAFEGLAEGTSRLLVALRAKSVDPIVLKGMALANLVYADPAARPMADVDVLVRPGERGTVEAVLQALGYQHVANEGDTDAYQAPGGLLLDLHHRFRLFEGHELAALSRDAPAPFLDVDSIRVLAPDPMLAHLVHHLEGHRRVEGLLLAWILDIALVLRAWSTGLDFDRVAMLLGPSRARDGLPRLRGFCSHRLGAGAGEGLPDRWSFDAIVRTRCRAAWNMGTARGWAHAAACWLGRSHPADRPRLYAADLVHAPLDRLRDRFGLG